MDLIDQIKENGWILSPEGLQLLTEDGKLTDRSAIEKKALNIDICELGGCGFSQDIVKGKCENFQGDVVVQVKKVRNISAPKANEESHHAPRMLKLSLTDGTHALPAVEMNQLPSISLNTPPGTKLKLKGEIAIKSGLLLLYPSNVEVLGGNVPKLIEKWKISQSFVNHTRGRVGVQDGPPPWIPFGEKMAPNNLSEKNLKILDDKDKENKDNGEFEAQRRDAIAEAKMGAKKVFGGGSKPIVDKNMQALMEKGFTLQEAQGALKQNKNFDRALRNLQKRTGKGGDDKEKDKEGGGGGKGRKKGDNDQVPSQKPTSTILLYQYVKDSLPGSTLEKEEEKEKEKERQQREWESSKPQVEPTNHRQRNFSHEKGRGGHRGSHQNSGTERRQRDNSRWQGQNQNQKPPRFQNQNRNKTDMSDHFDHFVARSDTGSSSSFRNTDSYFSSSKSNNPQSSQQYNGHRNYYKVDNMNYNQSSGSGEYRGQNSSFNMKPVGMPDIPEFPYKDSNSLMSMVPMNSISSGYNTRIPAQNGTVSKPDKYRWQKGDKCLAKYWEDNEYYKAEVTAVTKTTCMVRFLDYGNFEEVLRDDCFPFSMDSMPSHSNLPDDRNANFNNGILEFRRGGRGSYVKSGDSMGPRKNQRYSQPVYMPPPGRNAK